MCSSELAVTETVSCWMFLAFEDSSTVLAVCDAVDGCISGNRSVCPSISDSYLGALSELHLIGGGDINSASELVYQAVPAWCIWN